MKRFLPLLVVLGSGCGDNISSVEPEESSARIVCDDSTDCDDFLEDSLDVWLESGSDTDGSYTYSSEFASISGFRITTEVDVASGAVVARRGQGVTPDTETGELVPFSWSEVGPSLGTHSEGARPVSLSTLYEECVLDVLSVDRRTHQVILERFPSGALKSCTARPFDCADDCTFGPAIAAIISSAE